MSTPKPLTTARVNDLVLGLFARAPTSQKLDHAVRYLSTWNGSDKMFMVIQFALKIIIPYLDLRARLQHRSGKRGDANSTASAALAKLSGKIGDSRMLWRFWGLLPIYQWLTSLERMPPPTRELHTIERIQGWSMLLYYPLEHLFYMRSNGILPESVSFSVPFAKSLSVKLNASKLALWSTRACALYVLLQLVHLRADARLLKLRERALAKSKNTNDTNAEKAELAKRRSALRNELVENLANLPLTMHWSLERGIFSNEIWVSIFGLIAGIASFRNGWQATALPSSVPPPAPSVTEDIALEKLTGINSPEAPGPTNATVDHNETTGSLIVV